MRQRRMQNCCLAGSGEQKSQIPKSKSQETLQNLKGKNEPQSDSE
jgi:hypothetical protein